MIVYVDDPIADEVLFAMTAAAEPCREALGIESVAITPEADFEGDPVFPSARRIGW